MRHAKGSEFVRSHVFGLVAIFLAITGTAVSATAAEETATSSVVTDKKFKKLKQRVSKLEATLNTSTSGDLIGTYPNLQLAPNSVGSTEIAADAVDNGDIANNAVGSGEIAANAVTTTKIAADAVNKSKIGTSAVGADELDSISIESTDHGSVANGATSGPTGTGCTGGEQLITWGGFWDDTNDPGLRVQGSLFFISGFTYGSNQSGAAEDWNTYAMCLDV